MKCHIISIWLIAGACFSQDVEIISTNENTSIRRLTDDKDRIILAKPKPNVKQDDIDKAGAGFKVKTKGKWKHFEVPPGQSKKEAIKKLKGSGLFEHVTEPKIYKPQAVPNDPLFPQLWGMANIGAPQAWDIIRDVPTVIVAVVDTGIDYTHPDLQENLWTGPNGEHGYTCKDGTVTVGGEDDYGHGTHVAGTIGAVGNNMQGVVGVAWKAKIMSIKVLTLGSGSSIDIVNGLEKIVELKASGLPILVSNHSYGGVGSDPYMEDGFQTLAEADVFAAIAAGNFGKNIDVLSVVPAVFPFRNIISAMASDTNDIRAFFSDYGIVNTDIAAPGVNVLSTTRTNTYTRFNGTSMSAPHVAGLALLIRQLNTSLSAEQTRDIILHPGSYDTTDGLVRNNTSGRINTFKALTNPKIIENPFVLNRFPAVQSDAGNVIISSSVPAVVNFSTSDPDNDTLRSAVELYNFSDDIPSFFNLIISRNGVKSDIQGNSVKISGSPFAYQLANKLLGSVSDNRGGGERLTIDFEFSKDNSLKRPIKIKTWQAQTNAIPGAFSWIFDVDDPAKTNYIYLISLTFPNYFGYAFWSFVPGPQLRTNSVPIVPLKGAMRIFCVDKWLNWTNAEQILLPGGGDNPKCVLDVDRNEGNVPFTARFDLSKSTGPITHCAIYQLFGGTISGGCVHSETFISTGIKLMFAEVYNSTNGESDRLFVPMYCSRFMSDAVSEPAILLAPQDVRATLIGSQVTLTWSDTSTGEDRWELQRQIKTKGPWGQWESVATLPADSRTYSFSPSRVRYQFRIRACKQSACSGFSNTASIWIRQSLP